MASPQASPAATASPSPSGPVTLKIDSASPVLSGAQVPLSPMSALDPKDVVAFEELMAVDELTVVFRNFLTESLLTDPLDFVEAAEEYKSKILALQHGKTNREAAIDLYQKYVAPNADHELVIADSVREPIAKIIEQWKKEVAAAPDSKDAKDQKKAPPADNDSPAVLNVFDAVVAAVTALMKSELYPRFIKSDNYVNLARSVKSNRLSVSAGSPAGPRPTSGSVPTSPMPPLSPAAGGAPAAAGGDKKAAPAAAGSGGAAPAPAAADSKKAPELTTLLGLKKWINNNQYYKSIHVDVLEAKGLVEHMFSKPSPYTQITVDAFTQKSKPVPSTTTPIFFLEHPLMKDKSKSPANKPAAAPTAAAPKDAKAAADAKLLADAKGALASDGPIDLSEFKEKHFEFQILVTTQYLDIELLSGRTLKSDKVLGRLILPISEVAEHAKHTPMVTAGAIAWDAWFPLEEKKELPPPGTPVSKDKKPPSKKDARGEVRLMITLSPEEPRTGANASQRVTSKLVDDLRHLVSKKKRRFQENGFDLDLSYITTNVIAMGFPSVSMEGVYRNNLKTIKLFFTKRHPDAYRVYNLCAERYYDPSVFEGNVSRFPFEDHNPCNFHVIEEFCVDVHTWLSKHPQNIAAIHCKAGKGRTGLMIACYMVWSGFSVDGVSALEYYADKRTYNHKGVTIPSQARYVFYFDRYLTHIRRQRKSEGVGVQGAGGVPAIGAGGVMIGGMAVVEHNKPEKDDKKKGDKAAAAPEKQPEPEPVYASEAERLADTKRRMAAALAAAGVP